MMTRHGCSDFTKGSRRPRLARSGIAGAVAMVFGLSLSVGMAPSVSAATSATKSPIELGVQVVQVPSLSGINQNYQLPYKVLIDNLNAHGGILGHPVEPVYYTVNLLSSETGAEIEQQMCTLWTQDHKVSAVLLNSSYTDLTLSCLNKADIFTLGVGGSTTQNGETAATYADFPLYASAGRINFTRLGSVYINGLVASGFFNKNA